MRNQGNECAMYIYPSGGHGFGFRSTYKYHDQMLNELSTWLDNLKMPAKDAVRVACIGNSITEGFGIPMSSQLGYPAQLQKLLGSNYNVRNFGVSAHTMLNKGDNPYMKRPEWQYAQAFNPQVVVIKLGTNDSKPYNWQYGKEFSADLQQMIDALKALPTKPTIYLASPIKVHENPYQINDSIVANEIIPIINKVAKKNKLQVIDLYHSITDKKLYLSDGVHPNDKGTAEMAKVIANAIKQ
jgi:lysophospholipase L1-like esterase